MACPAHFSRSDPSGCNALDQMEEILTPLTLGHLALWADRESCIVPLNYTYVKGEILLHCALGGKKLDVIHENPNVCFEVSEQSGEVTAHAGEGCSQGFESAICWGTAQYIDDIEERAAPLTAFQRRYETGDRHRRRTSRERAAKCGAVAIAVRKMTGRRRADKECEQWQWEQ